MVLIMVKTDVAFSLCKTEDCNELHKAKCWIVQGCKHAAYASLNSDLSLSLSLSLLIKTPI